MESLLMIRPTITEFNRVVGAIVQKGIYHQYQEGRPMDAFAYIVNGSADYDFGDYSLTVKEGDVLFLAKGSSYTMTVTTAAYGFLYVNFSFDTKENKYFKSDVFEAEGGRKTEDLFHKILSVWDLGAPTAKEECMALLYMIYADFLKAANASYHPSAKRRHMEDALKYIDKNLSNEALSVAEIAAAVHMSVTNFRRTFKEAFNMSPMRYINMKRISRAKELLYGTNKSVTEIAYEVGYSSIYYFGSAFKKEVKCSPSEYRQLGKRNPSI